MIITLYNCKKSSNSPGSEIDCINSSFIDTLDIQIVPKFINEDNKGNITILGNDDGIVKILRLDPYGQLQWVKKYPQLIGNETGMTYIDESSFLINTSTSHYEYELAEEVYDQVWVKEGLMLDSSNNYIEVYGLEFSWQPKLQMPNTNTTYVSKLGSDGNILWTKEFSGDFSGGNSLYRMDHNSFLFVASEGYGPYFEIIDYEGLENDTVYWPNDGNKQIVYKMNANGNIVWSATIDSIFCSTKKVENDLYNFHSLISLNGDRIFVGNNNNIYELSTTGQVVKKHHPEYDAQGNVFYSMKKADESSNFILGYLTTFDGHLKNYFIKYDVNNDETVWKKESYRFRSGLSSMQNIGVFTFTYDHQPIINKFDGDGNHQWQFEISELGDGMPVFKASCNGGVILAYHSWALEQNNLIIIKTAKDGSY